MKILITGALGFIATNLIYELSKNNKYQVVGLDIYDEKQLSRYGKKLALDRYNFCKENNNEYNYYYSLTDINFASFDLIIHLGASTGVRTSIECPTYYYQQNVIGFNDILEKIKRENSSVKLIYASSSSIYGNGDYITKSPYALTKQINEQQARLANELWGLRSLGLRFFTVYGEWGREDMAIYKFTKSILDEKKFYLYNNGNMTRDFTYIKDLIDSIIKLIDVDFDLDVIDIGAGKPINLMSLVLILEKALNKKAKLKSKCLQLGDVVNTCADPNRLRELITWEPKVGIEEGLENYVKWFKEYYDRGC